MTEIFGKQDKRAWQLVGGNYMLKCYPLLHFAHPSYPQDKGKVERCVQDLNREFVNHLREFLGWLKGKLREYREWFNHSWFHRGIKALPVDLYECNIRN